MMDCIIMRHQEGKDYEVIFYDRKNFHYHNYVATISKHGLYRWNYFSRKDLCINTSYCEQFINDFVVKSGGLHNLDYWEWGVGRLPDFCFDSKPVVQ